MIQSILDNDLYKFTMQQAVLYLYPEAQVQYRFINRGTTPFPAGFGQSVRARLQRMTEFSLSSQQKTFLTETCPFFTQEYLDYLASYRFELNEVTISQNATTLSIEVNGHWARTILWEVPLMAIVSELYYTATGQEAAALEQRQATNRNKAKVLQENGICYVDFGTRRRFSAANHEQVIGDLKSHEPSTLLGTSNVHLAQQFDLKPIGTVAHEWFMFHGAVKGYGNANKAALDAWLRMYDKDLGIALTDTYTTDIFLSAFSAHYAGRLTGVRQDSGDPFLFADKIVNHYEQLGMGASGKVAVFSDGLDLETAVLLHGYCAGRIKDIYGIGTNLTNDVGVTPLNIVIKLSKCRLNEDEPWQDAVKLSDDVGKHTGTQAELKSCLDILEL